MTQNISPNPPLALSLVQNVVSFGPDSLANPHIAVIFTEQEWATVQGAMFDAWLNSPPHLEEVAGSASPSLPN